MKKQQEVYLRSGDAGATGARELLRAAVSSSQSELARLRIERNRAARHARGAIARFTIPQ